MNLIIPSAKVVPEELQKLGKLPAVIYPINQRIVFDYLYEQYKDQVETIDIICYENACRTAQGGRRSNPHLFGCRSLRP